MTLQAGTRLGPYEIQNLVGAGGMGEVYRARDPRLGRDVAIKILPASFSSDAERVRRFEHEARAAGVLNHPNITAVYDIGREEGSLYVVSELLEGETLRSRIAGSPLSIRRAVDYALQVAHGLSAAHEKGIVHRDLKPENVFVTKDGRVKILDFGLAKLIQAEDGRGLQTDLPTATAGTEPGVVLGTLGYMSPEQVRGKPADARSDIFSFGAILYEMLSGKRAFHGDSAADTMSAILKEDPPEISLTNKNVPPGLDRIVRHCLEKNPEQRFHSAHDLAFDLEALSDASGTAILPMAEEPRSWKVRRLLVPAGLILLGAALGALLQRSLGAPEITEPATYRSLTYSGQDFSPTASPDGKVIAFSSERDGKSRIWLKQLAGGGEIALTSGDDDLPRFSPDGSMIAFTRHLPGNVSAIWRVAVVGGEPRKVIDDGWDADWSPDGRQVVFLRGQVESIRRQRGSQSTTQGIAVMVAASDGSQVREIRRFDYQFLFSPRWSPDGRSIALTTGEARAESRIVLLDLAGGEPKTISPPFRLGLLTTSAWSGSGRDLIYAQSESVTADFRSTSGRVIAHNLRSGKARSILWRPSLGRGLDVLADGRLVFDSDSSRQNLQEIPLRSGPGGAEERWLTRGTSSDRQPVYSPDGREIAFSSDRAGNLDLWVVSRESGALRRLTDDPAEDWDPAFSPDGRQLVWSSNRGGHFEIWLADRDGSGARQLSRDGVDAENPTFTRDGRWIVYTSFNPARRGLWRVRPDGSGSVQFVKGLTAYPEVSPDGIYVAHRRLHQTQEIVQIVRVSDGSPAAPPIPVAAGGGRSRWAPDGSAIVFSSRNDQGVTGFFIQDFRAGEDTSNTRRPFLPFDPDLPVESLGISPDGKRVTVSLVDRQSGIMIADGVPGVEAPRRALRP